MYQQHQHPLQQQQQQQPPLQHPTHPPHPQSHQPQQPQHHHQQYPAPQQQPQWPMPAGPMPQQAGAGQPQGPLACPPGATSHPHQQQPQPLAQPPQQQHPHPLQGQQPHPPAGPPQPPQPQHRPPAQQGAGMGAGAGSVAGGNPFAQYAHPQYHQGPHAGPSGPPQQAGGPAAAEAVPGPAHPAGPPLPNGGPAHPHPHPLAGQRQQQQQQQHHQQQQQQQQQPGAGPLPPPLPHQQQQQQQQQPGPGPGPGPGLGPGPGPGPQAAPGARPARVSYSAFLRLEDRGRFALKVGYHKQLEAVFATMHGEWDKAEQQWVFPVSMYKHVMASLADGRLRHRGVDITLNQELGPPAFVLRMLEEAAGRVSDERLYDKLLRFPEEGPNSLDSRMMPFQRDGVRHGLRHGGRVLIGDEMGLGKTVQACCLIKAYYGEDVPVLVVTPKSLRETWADALYMWLKLTDKEVCVISGKEDIPLVEGYKMDRSAVRVFVVSYDTVSRTPEPFEALKPRMVVLDEAHYIKSMSAQRTKMVMPIVQSAKRAVLLTGTPAANKPMEIMALLVALVPKAKIHQKDFGARYARQDKFNKFIGSRNEAELNRLLLGTGVMIRRLKSEVLKHLPPKRRQQIFIRLPDKQARAVAASSARLAGLKQVVTAMMNSGGGGGGAGGGAGAAGALAGAQREQQNEIMQLWRQNAKLKGAAVAEYCEDLLEGEDPPKFLLFAHHKELLNTVEEKVKKLRFKYIRIDGDTPGEDRNRLTQKFQEEEDVKVALLSIKAAGVGLTFTRSSLVVFSELSWIPGDIQQAEDRCHRIGQAATSVNIHYLLVRGSVDEIMWDCLQSKLGSVGKALDGSGAYIKVDATRELCGLGLQGAGPGGASGEGHHHHHHHQQQQQQQQLDGFLGAAGHPAPQHHQDDEDDFVQQPFAAARAASGGASGPAPGPAAAAGGAKGGGGRGGGAAGGLARSGSGSSSRRASAGAGAPGTPGAVGRTRPIESFFARQPSPAPSMLPGGADGGAGGGAGGGGGLGAAGVQRGGVAGGVMAVPVLPAVAVPQPAAGVGQKRGREEAVCVSGDERDGGVRLGVGGGGAAGPAAKRRL
ncbi:hypothetical protein CHLRE_03g199350v5 [Chlamydomonas reinhardtii]|uniref:Uncharacterized protein n=1 Tax=Chlamydomonas reinhardtii TaxID=3055 RepID=A0A2K3DZG9_CHLRE|nr:uncharacterized protein CHLRE_03g199350v5 [Chlamydomonas reinhardtii]PNW85934.1 hypothetical protein CHLRE_03g199350v5 [Chlamydomonas reinhardtii]